MRRFFSIVIVILGIPISAFSQINLIINESFEEGIQNTVLAWLPQPLNAQGIIRAWESNIARTGSYSVSIEKNNSQAHAFWAQVVKPKKDEIYSIRAYTKSETGTLTFAIVMRFWRDGILDKKPSMIKFSQTNADNWNEFSFQFHYPANADSLLFMLELTDNSGKIYFDDISLTEILIQQDNIIGFNSGSDGEFYYSFDDNIYYVPDPVYTMQNKAGYIGSSKPPQKSLGIDIIGGAEGKERIYGEARYGIDEYRFDVDNGLYAVQLHFCENEFDGPGFRMQNVKIENEMVLKDFDAIAFVSKSYVVIHRFLTELQDGQLNIEFFSATNSMISAVSVKKIEANLDMPEIPANVKIIGGFNQNIIDWKANFEDDFKGFNIFRKSGEEKFVLLNDTPYPLSRYIDDDVEVGIEYEYQISAIDLFANESDRTAIISAVPVSKIESNLPVYELFISDEELYKLNVDIYSDEYVQATFKHDGRSWKVGVRYRGNVTQRLSKKNYKIKFADDELFEGMAKLNLNATMNDPSMIIDQITYALRRDIGVLTQDTKPLHLDLNGKFIGVYLQREQEDKYFLENHGLSYGNIYRSQSGNFAALQNLEKYQRAYEKETNTSSNYDDLIELIEFINNSNEDDFKNDFPRMFNVAEFLRAYAILNCVADIDQHFHNFLLIHSFSDDKWRICNWDHNTTFRNPTTPIDLNTEESPSPIGNASNYLFNKLFHIDEFRYYYITKLLEYTNTVFSVEQMNIRINAYQDLIDFDAMRDIYKYGWENNNYWLTFVNLRKKFVENRVEYIKQEAPKFLPQNFNPYENSLFINEIFVANDGSGFIEIYNDAVIPLDISGFTLSNEESNFNKYIIAEGIIIEAKSYYIVNIGDDLGFELNNSGDWIGLFSNEGIIHDSINFPELSNNNSYGRQYKNLSVLIEFDTPTPNEDNKEILASDLPVVINEFMASNSTTIADEIGNYGDWIELYNNSDEEVDISSYYLSDDIETPFEWKIPDNTTIPARGFILIWADGNTNDGPLHATFKLSAKGESIGLFTPDGKSIVDSITFALQTEDIAYGRNGDANSEWIFFEVPTPNNTNVKTKPEILPILINEFMASNSETIQDESGAYPDWIELYNNSDEEIDISDYYLTDEPLGEPTKWRIPNGTSLEARGFLLLWADSDTDEGDKHTNFKLGKSGDSIAIFAKDGKTEVDLIAFGEQETDISYGRTIDANEQWISFSTPTPNATNNSSALEENDESMFTLEQNYPNPFSDETNIRYRLNRSTNVKLTVYNSFGKQVAILVDTWQSKGEHKIVFDGMNLNPGVYYYKIGIANEFSIGKMILLK